MAAPSRSHAHSHSHAHPLPSHLRKKKHHLLQTAGSAVADDGPDAEDNSSRDASEEDNDDISGASDSASSMRASVHRSSSSHLSALAASAAAASLPTSARDRALVESNPRRPSAGAAAAMASMGDKTPGTSSPRRLSTSTGHASQSVAETASAESGIGAASSARRPSAGLLNAYAARDATVAQTLERASAALSSSSSDAPRPVGLDARKSRTHGSDSSSAGSGGDGPGHGVKGSLLRNRSPRLDLGALPAPAVGGNVTSTGTAVPTPRGVEPKQLNNAMVPNIAATTNLLQGVSLSPRFHADADTDTETNLDISRSTATERDSDVTAASPYDGDVEFAARSYAGQTQQQSQPQAVSAASASANFPNSSASLSAFGTAPREAPSHSWAVGDPSQLTSNDRAETPHSEAPVPISTPDTIRDYIRKAIYEPDPLRDYRINLPPDGGRNPNRPVRIYADGVYDLFHYAHSLQLRQAKHFFPCVHLIVGVVSSASCAQHKNEPVLNSAERYASVRNCRWVDEVLEDAPWIIDQSLIDRLQIDYVAHDEAPYASKDGGNSDIYRFCKEQGKFLPTLRTPGVSTSELLGRIVSQYRQHSFDDKLAKIGLHFD